MLKTNTPNTFKQVYRIRKRTVSFSNKGVTDKKTGTGEDMGKLFIPVARLVKSWRIAKGFTIERLGNKLGYDANHMDNSYRRKKNNPAKLREFEKGNPVDFILLKRACNTVQLSVKEALEIRLPLKGKKIFRFQKVIA